jgi:hypothetical protein
MLRRGIVGERDADGAEATREPLGTGLAAPDAFSLANGERGESAGRGGSGMAQNREQEAMVRTSEK